MKPSKVVDDAIEKFREALKKDAEDGDRKGWDMLMEFDRYTSREWMAMNQQGPDAGTHDPTRPPFNASTVSYLETMNG